MTLEPFEDFAEYGDPAAADKRHSTKNLLVAIGEVIPTYYQWVQRLPSEVQPGYLKQALADLAGLSAAEVQSAARRLLDRGMPAAKELVPAEIRRLAKKGREVKINQTVGQKTIQCPRCQDYGTLTVYGPETVRLWKAGRLPGHYGITYVVRCTCPAGQQWKACSLLEDYQPGVHLPCRPHQSIPEALKEAGYETV